MAIRQNMPIWWIVILAIYIGTCLILDSRWRRSLASATKVQSEFRFNCALEMLLLTYIIIDCSIWLGVVLWMALCISARVTYIFYSEVLSFKIICKNVFFRRINQAPWPHFIISLWLGAMSNGNGFFHHCDSRHWLCGTAFCFIGIHK